MCILSSLGCPLPEQTEGFVMVFSKKSIQELKYFRAHCLYAYKNMSIYQLALSLFFYSDLVCGDVGQRLCTVEGEAVCIFLSH